MSRIVIFANGHLPDVEKARTILGADDYIIAADGGTRHALALGVTPNVVIGDLDSMRRAEIEEVKSREIQIILYPRDKNETDLELALNHALGLKPDGILVIGALGDRLDQTLANLALISGARFSGLDVRLDDGVEEAFFCRASSEVRGRSGDVISLIPWLGKVEGVRTENLKWPLRGETLYPERSRGVSNEMAAALAKVGIASGLLLVVHRRQ